MHILLTLCSAEKDDRDGALPALERYSSERVQAAVGMASALGLPLFFLSGKHGLLAATDQIEWYDVALELDGVSALTPTVASRLASEGVRHATLFGRDRETPGWEPYYRLAEAACAMAGVELRFASYRGPE